MNAGERARDEAPGGSEVARPLGRVSGLDGVRGLGLLMVLLVHFTNTSAVPLTVVPDRVFREMTDGMWIALDSFFVLSGFLITGILYETKAAPRYFRNFYVRRCLRIFPAYYAYLFFLFVIMPLVLPMEHKANAAIGHDRVWFVSYMMNIRIALDHAQRPDLAFTSHLWSLAVEEHFYFVWPFLVLLLNRRQLMAVCVAAVGIALGTRTVILAAGLNHWLSYALTPARIDGLAVGAFIALAMRDPDDFKQMLRWLRPLALASCLLILGFSLAYGQFDRFDPWARVTSHTALAFIFGLLIVAVVTAPSASRISRFFGHKVLTTLGTYSYAMYIVHFSIAYFLLQYTDLGRHVPTVWGSYIPGQLVFSIVAFVPTFVVGWLSWHLLESRALKLKVFFPYGRRKEIPIPRAPQLAPAPAGAD